MDAFKVLEELKSKKQVQNNLKDIWGNSSVQVNDTGV